MGAHIELDPEVANQLAALAASRGVTVQQLLREFLDQMSTLAPNGPLPTLDEFETDMREFADGTENLQSFYTGDYSREDIHFDHD